MRHSPKALRHEHAKDGSPIVCADCGANLKRGDKVRFYRSPKGQDGWLIYGTACHSRRKLQTPEVQTPPTPTPQPAVKKPKTRKTRKTAPQKPSQAAAPARAATPIVIPHRDLHGRLDASLSAHDAARALTQLNKVIPTTAESIPALTHVLMTADDDYIYFHATDLETHYSLAVPAEVRSHGAICLHLPSLLKYMKAQKRETLQVYADDTPMHAVMASSLSTTQWEGISPEDFPEFPSCPADTSFALDPSPFLAAARRILPAVSSEKSRFQLSGALLSADGKLVATDGHRLHLAPTGSEPLPDHAEHIVPRNALRFISSLPAPMRPGVLTCGTSAHHGTFIADTWQLTYRKLEGTFPSYERVIPKKNGKLNIVVQPASLSSALQTVLPSVSERSRTVRATFNGRIELTASRADHGESTATCPVLESTGKEITLGINPDYLLDVCRVAAPHEITLSLWDEKSPTRIQSPDVGFDSVIMPVRL